MYIRQCLIGNMRDFFVSFIEFVVTFCQKKEEEEFVVNYIFFPNKLFW